MPPSDLNLRTALREHAGRIEGYRDGTLTDDAFRPLRLGYGLYYQREDTSYMQRIKLPGGLLTVAQAEAVASLADDYGRGRLHVTTRQDVQLHWVPLDCVMPLYERLHAVGITTRGAAANAVRNVTGCVHAGLWPGEPFDVTPYVWATHEHFLFHPLNLALPRKLKPAFAGCPDDCVEARINDLAYYPRRVDGRRGFAVYAAGGLGAQPFLAHPIRGFVPAEDVLLMTEAVMRLWHRDGEWKNRKRARMKYLFQRLGAERFIAAVDQLYAQVETEEGPSLRAELAELVARFETPSPCEPPAPVPAGGDADAAHWIRTNVFAQKQAGYYAATVKVPLGDLTGDQLRGIAGIVRRHGAGLLRATVDQNLLVPWLSGRSLDAVYLRLRELQLAEPDAGHLTDVTSCPGADYCSMAVTKSMGVADAVRRRLQAGNGRVEELGPVRVKISGCPNACGQHHVGAIGFTGLGVQAKDGSVQTHYSLILGGRAGETTAAIGRRIPTRFPEADVPAIVAALAEHYRETRRTGETFSDFVQRVGVDRLGEVARQAAAAGGAGSLTER